MGPTDDPDAFLGSFERVATMAGWERSTWALRLAPYLGGEAPAAFMAWGETQARSYEAVKATILDRVGLSTERYRQWFRAARWTAGLRPRAFAQRLTDWTTRWLRPPAQTMEEVMDQVLAEQFLLGLPDPMCVWVQRHQLAQGAETVGLTEEDVEAEGPRQVVKPGKRAGPGKGLPDAAPKRGSDPGPLEVQGRCRGQRVGLVKDLPYPVLLGADWGPLVGKARSRDLEPEEGVRGYPMEGAEGGEERVKPPKAQEPRPPGCQPGRRQAGYLSVSSPIGGSLKG